MTDYELVREWHRAFGCPVLDAPTVPAPDRARLRQALLREEARELLDELDTAELCPSEGGGADLFPNLLPQIAKECCDLLYVVYGTLLEFGIDPGPAMAEVQRSNMSKLGEDGRLIRRADGKVLKGPNYTVADMAGVIAAQAAVRA